MQPQIGFPPFPHPERDRIPRERFNRQPASDPLSVRLDVSIQADARRLFHALTDPEYLEAWLSLPGHHRGCSMIAGKYDRDYLIEHFCDGGRQSILISGRYLVLRRRHVEFSWRVDGDFCVPETAVEIRLLGDFERTTLILRHSGFTSRRESAWHRDLWNTSIGRLAALYGAPVRLESSSHLQREPRSKEMIRASVNRDEQRSWPRNACGSAS